MLVLRYIEKEVDVKCTGLRSLEDAEVGEAARGAVSVAREVLPAPLAPAGDDPLVAGASSAGEGDHSPLSSSAQIKSRKRAAGDPSGASLKAAAALTASDAESPALTIKAPKPGVSDGGTALGGELTTDAPERARPFSGSRSG